MEKKHLLILLLMIPIQLAGAAGAFTLIFLGIEDYRVRRKNNPVFFPGVKNQLGNGNWALGLNQLPPRINDPQETIASVFQKKQELPVVGAGEWPLIQKSLEDLGRALNDKNEGQVGQRFNINRMVLEILRQGNFPNVTDAEHNTLIDSHSKSSSKYGTNNILLGFEKIDIRSARMISQDEALVYTRDISDKGIISRHRWWLKKTNGEWLIYDFQNLASGPAHVEYEVALMTPEWVQFQPPPWKFHLPVYSQAVALYNQFKDQEAEKNFRDIPNGVLPVPYEASRFYFLGLILANQGKREEALKEIDKAEFAGGKAPLYVYQRVFLYNTMKNHAKAMECVREYYQLLGEDSDLKYEEGLAHQGLKQNLQAEKCFQSCLHYDPYHWEALHRFRSLLSKNRKQEWAPYMVKAMERANQMNLLPGRIWSDRDVPAIQIWMDYVRKLNPNEPEIDHYGFQIQIVDNKFKEAIETFQSALKKQFDLKKKKFYTQDFVWGMNQAGKGMEAYKACPNPSEALNILGEDLIVGRGPGKLGLGPLLEEHAKKHPKDPWLAFYRAEILIDKKEYLKAKEEIKNAKEWGQNPENRINDLPGNLPLLDGLIITVEYHLGNGLKIFNEKGRLVGDFDQLVGLMTRDKKTDDLKKLLEAHRQQNPLDQIWEEWDAELEYLKGNYRKTLEILELNRITLLQRNPWKFNQKIIRTLVKLKQTNPAEQEAERILRENGDKGIAIVVFLASGKGKRAEELMKTWANNPYNLNLIYADPDVGELLRTDPRFADIRALFPEPVGPPRPGLNNFNFNPF